MRKALFLIAFILLSNPFFSNVDILPDFIGYILIMIALSRPSYYDDKARLAYKGARNMLVATIFKFASIYFITLELDETISLLFSFTFFVIELVFGIPFIIKLFDYFANRAMKTENSTALKIVDGIKLATIILFGVRLLLATLPDFILLTAGDPLSQYHNDLSSFRPMLVVFSVILSLPITIAWIPMESVLVSKLFTKNETVLTNEAFEAQVEHKCLHFNLNAQKRAFIIVGVLSLLAFEFKLDNINVVFNTLLPLTFIAIYLFLLLKRYIKLDKMFYVLCPLTVLQLISFILVTVKTKAYFKEYTLLSVYKISQAETMYFAIIPILVINSLLFISCVSIIIYLLIKNGREALVSNMPEIMPNTDMDYTIKEYDKKSKTLGIVTTVFLALSSLFSPIVFAIMPRIDELTKIQIFAFETTLPIFPAFMPIQFILTASFVITMIATLITVYENSLKKLHYQISLD